jgi:AcrR family transcriptional regulator
MTPYRYFADKNAILAAVRARAFTRHAEALEAAWEATRGDPIAASNAVGEAYVDFAFAHPEAYKLMFDISQPDEADYPEFMAAAERSRRTMTRHLEGLAEAGQFEGDPGLVGHMYWAALHGPIMLAFSSKLQPQYNARRLIAALMETLHRGLFPSPLDAPGVSGRA